MTQPGEGKSGQIRARRRRPRRAEKPPTQVQPATPRWTGEPGPKICRKCGGRMHPADWIWQKYGLCLGWRCANCKEKVMARSLPFKGLRKRTLDPDEIAAAAATKAAKTDPEKTPRAARPPHAR